MRMVVIGTRQGLTIANYEDNQEFLEDFERAFPNVLGSKEIITTGDQEPNKLNVYAEEYDGINHPKKNLEGIAFWLEYQIKQRICK